MIKKLITFLVASLSLCMIGLKSAHADNLRACKQKWLESNGITWEAIFTSGRHDKRVYANESSLLIDDTRENIIDWTENEGYGIYHTSHKNTINYLYDLELL